VFNGREKRKKKKLEEGMKLQGRGRKGRQRAGKGKSAKGAKKNWFKSPTCETFGKSEEQGKKE